MFFQKPLFVLRNRGAFSVDKIEVHNYCAPGGAEPALLPCFVVYREGLGSDAAYGAADLHIVLKKHLTHKIIIRVGHNEGPYAVRHPEIGLEDPEQGIPAKLKPLRQNHIVDVPQPVDLSEPGRYRYDKHAVSFVAGKKPGAL
jgi:hypothetical protein